ncbi:DNA mismatch repair protein MutL [Olavius algarvensis associated proteobacterium Delta 3]|nr:DNA mismatch repair protein MutL [Olavius algarvensis associated proteobacterium Delta 3]
MSNIRILPEILSNKIAAGEVVERPASVVKELIENALDAGSDRILVELEHGGRSLIRVSDNGCGMPKDDALLSIERYATSKIRSDQDLFAIRSLGFRGEALPSIASVSRFQLISRTSKEDIGTEIQIAGGKIRHVKDVGSPPGTMISVRQLFFNTPARRKFLKTVNTEMGHCADVVSRMALAYPGVQFRLHHNGRRIKNWPKAIDPIERIADVLGREMKTALLPVESTLDDISLSGWLASPNLFRTTARGMVTYVNRRFVRDRTLRNALMKGYSGRLVKGQFPVAVLFLDVPADKVDVNVHPAKLEIRFAEPPRVHGLVSRAAASVLQRIDVPGWGSRAANQRIAEPREAYAPLPSGPRSVPSETDRPPAAHEPISTVTPADVPTDPGAASGPVQADLWHRGRFSDLRVIGQFHNTYIVCESGSRLVLIDQHAAHERIYFEQFERGRAEDHPSSQRLLVPETLELGFKEADVLKALSPDLATIGLDVEPFGGTTFVIKSVPDILAGREAAPLVVEIAEKAVEIGVAGDLDTAVQESLMLTACHSVIRANQPLSDTEIRHLLRQLDQCENPAHCPHGRPTFVEWKTAELEKLFKRIV